MPCACIFVPDFPAQAILRAEPELRDYELVVLDGRAPLQRPIAMNEHARKKGVQPEMPRTLLEQCPSLLLRPRSPSLEVAAHRAMLAVAGEFSPRIEELAADTLMLDLAGMGKLFGRPQELAHELARRLRALGLEARVAIAANADAALSAARGIAGITVIPEGREPAMLGPLPLTVLEPPTEILETLERWGIRDFRGLGALPTPELSERLGQAGVQLQARARGRLRRPLMGREEPTEFSAHMDLEYPVEELEPLAFILNRLLGDVCSRLGEHSAAASQIHLRLILQAGDGRAAGDAAPPGRVDVGPGLSPARSALKDGPTFKPEQNDAPWKYEKAIPLPIPTRDAKLLLNHLRLHLESEPPQAPVLKVVLRVHPAPPRVAQGGLFVPLAPDPEKLEATLARIAGLVGRQNVGSARLLDSHRPGSFQMQPFEFLPARDTPQAGAGREKVALRIYRPPAAAVVGLKREVPDRLAFGDIRGRVITAGGPWRASGCWWQPEAWEVDEWDVEIETTGSRAPGFYRIYLDRTAGKWFVRGEYD